MQVQQQPESDHRRGAAQHVIHSWYVYVGEQPQPRDRHYRLGVAEDVHRQAFRAGRPGILPSEFLDGLSYSETEHRWSAGKQRVRRAFVAKTLDGELVGLVEGVPAQEGPPDIQAELHLIYLLAAYQRQGLGRRLVVAVANDLRADGYQSMLVWALRDTDWACRFYEALGGAKIGWRTFPIEGKGIVEAVCYGWRNINDLADGSA